MHNMSFLTLEVSQSKLNRRHKKRGIMGVLATIMIIPDENLPTQIGQKSSRMRTFERCICVIFSEPASFLTLWLLEIILTSGKIKLAITLSKRTDFSGFKRKYTTQKKYLTKVSLSILGTLMQISSKQAKFIHMAPFTESSHKVLHSQSQIE